jgi:hypothetical protein
MSKAREHYEYQAIQAFQNAGLACPFCASYSGHFHTCPTINGATAEAANFVDGTITEQDRILAHALGVQL